MTLGTDILETRRRRFGRWIAAAVLVVTLHVGGAAMALYTWPEEIDEEPSGAIAIELAPLTATPDAPTEDLALGPQADEATPAAAAPQPEKTDEPRQQETLIAERSPAPDPEVAVSVSKPKEKMQDEKPTDRKEDAKKEKTEKSRQPAEQQPVQASAPTHASSPQRTETTRAMPTASRHGRSSKPSKAQLTWQKALRLQLERNKRYPSSARQQRQQGTSTVQFSIDRQGRVIAARLIASSGVRILDEEAVNVLSRASPLPPPPDDLGGAILELELPIQFKIKD
jgi:protein TonB